MGASLPTRRARITLDTSCDWLTRAACRCGDPDAMFVRGAKNERVVSRTCTACPVRYECLAEALDNRITWGVWGGLSYRERRILLRRSPGVTDWRRALETALNNQSLPENDIETDDPLSGV